MTQQILLKGLCMAAIIMTASCGDKKDDKAAATKPATPPVTRVEGYIVKQQAINENLNLPGTILPFEETEIHSEVTGRVTAINFAEGTMVSKGALLVKLFDGDLVAQLKKLEVQLKIAEKTVERQQELLKIGGISQQEVDLSGLQVSNIKADMDLLRISISKTSIRAPYSGRLGFRNVSLGAYLTPTTSITTLKQVNQLKIEFSVPGKYTTIISPTLPVKFNIEGSPNTYFAKITATESSITENNRSLTVRAVVQQIDKYIMPGAFASIKLAFDANPTAIMIPSQAIIPQARYKKVIVSRNGLASFETVETGMRDSSSVEITSGLKVGDTIITSGILTLKPNAKIQLNKVQ